MMQGTAKQVEWIEKIVNHLPKGKDSRPFQLSQHNATKEAAWISEVGEEQLLSLLRNNLEQFRHNLGLKQRESLIRGTNHLLEKLQTMNEQGKCKNPVSGEMLEPHIMAAMEQIMVNPPEDVRNNSTILWKKPIHTSTHASTQRPDPGVWAIHMARGHSLSR